MSFRTFNCINDTFISSFINLSCFFLNALIVGVYIGIARCKLVQLLKKVSFMQFKTVRDKMYVRSDEIYKYINKYMVNGIDTAFSYL